ncbi:ammonium transporter [Kamptonema formosum]|uniref:ammonium transporter n=1 Tax=Kamptonema formosum TaxID=331992 RepID=UPI000349FE99|nr:ammonium transporter [Oscillatoria sp. PCC 10802]
MLKKVLIAGIVSVCLLSGLLMGRVVAQDPSPSPEQSAPAEVAPEGAAPAEGAPEGVAPAAGVSPQPAAPAAGVSPQPAAPVEVSPQPVAPAAGVSPQPVAPAPVFPEPVVAPATGEETAAAAASPIDTGDTAWMLISSALVLLMTPGLAFFYGGLVRSRNVLNTMMMSLILMAVVGVVWVLWGYSLAFAPVSVTPPAAPGEAATFDANPIIGSLNWMFLGGVAFDAPDPVGYAPTIPHQLFMAYQMMFAMITPALISGAIVERMSFKAYFWFILIWATFIYSPLAHWVWGKGWIGAMGALDFAGGTVVHISSGVSAVVAAWMIGPRKTFMVQPAAPHNVPYVLLGIGILWFGWMGFNAGSALGAGSLAAVAFVATTVSAAAAGLTWVILEWVLRGKPTAIGIASGFLAGLVGVTPAAGFVTPIGALLIGSITSVCCFFGVSLRAKLQFDDSLDTFPVHGLGGTVGALLTGIFATKEVNAAGNNGLLFGNPSLLVTQIVGVVATYIFAAAGTFVILKALGAIMELRVKPESEDQGLDINEHGEEGYGEEFASGLSFPGK